MTSIGVGIGIRLRPGAGAGFGEQTWTPAEITTAVWLDANDSGTVTEGATFIWADKSGNGNDATQSSASLQPSVSGANIVFDGSDKLLTLDTRLNAVLSLYVMCNWTDTTGDNRVIVGDIVSTAWHGDTAASGNLFSAAFGAADVINGDNYIDGTLTAGALARYTSRTVHAIQPVAGKDLDQIGRDRGFSSRTFKGNLNEIVIVEGYLSTDDRQKMEGYLAHKWGTTGSLPAGHPYKTDPPTV